MPAASLCPVHNFLDHVSGSHKCFFLLFQVILNGVTQALRPCHGCSLDHVVVAYVVWWAAGSSSFEWRFSTKMAWRSNKKWLTNAKKVLIYIYTQNNKKVCSQLLVVWPVRPMIHMQFTLYTVVYVYSYICLKSYMPEHVYNFNFDFGNREGHRQTHKCWMCKMKKPWSTYNLSYYQNM